MSESGILVVVPTKGRPGNAVRLENELRKEPVEYVFCVDSNDEFLPEYRDRIQGNLLVRKPMRLGPWLNYVSSKVAEDYDMIGFLGDDVIPRTPGWAEVIHRHNVARNAIVYTEDGNDGIRLPTAVFMNSGLIQRLGHMALPGLQHYYIDEYWRELGLALGSLYFLRDILLEHDRPFKDGSPLDPTYRWAVETAETDKELLRKYLSSDEFRRDVERVR